MTAVAPSTVETFSDVVRWLQAQGSAWLGRDVDMDTGPRGEAALVQDTHTTVAVVDAGGHLPQEFDVVLVAGPSSGLAEALSELGSHRVLALPLPCPVAVVEQSVRNACAAADAFIRAKWADHLLEIGMALNAERNPGRVLELILTHARRITSADAGSIYLVEEDRRHLRFKAAQNDSLDIDFSEFTVAVTDHSVVGTCVQTGQVLNIPDLYAEGGPVVLGRRFVHDRSFDERFGYQTRSMITTPMRPPHGDVLGVLQLINAKRRPGPLGPRDFDTVVVPFSAEDKRLCSALAAQGAVALENARLYAEIQDLFEGFVRASVHAIEQRDPSTSGHSQRVADLTVALAQAVDRDDGAQFRDVGFDADELKEMEYAGLLHDFGKVGVREEVLVKAKKLHGHQLDAIMARFDHMRTALQVELLSTQLARARKGQQEDADLRSEYARRLQDLEDMVRVVVEANEPSVLQAEATARLHDVARVEFRDARNRTVRLLEDDEVTALLVRRGSLTESERVEIQSHVTHTYNFLVRIPWGRALRQVPEIAGKHHEYLNGSGYPYHVGGQEIPIQTRMMTVSDIFDALTASDRPYKKAVPVPRALDILRFEVEAGKIDEQLLDLFIEAKIFQTIGLQAS